jgi:hypothetical protein
VVVAPLDPVELPVALLVVVVDDTVVVVVVSTGAAGDVPNGKKPPPVFVPTVVFVAAVSGTEPSGNPLGVESTVVVDVVVVGSVALPDTFASIA